MRKFLKVLLIVILAVILLVVGFFAYLHYEISIKEIKRDTAVSPNGEYSVELISIGQPVLFGAAHGKVVLKQGKKNLCQQKFQYSDDGGQIRKENWTVEWSDKGAKIVISASEQYDNEITLNFDRTCESRELTTKFGK